MEFSMDKYKFFFFDFDGVITDSVNIKTEAFVELYKPYGEEAVAYVENHHKSHGGMSRFLKIRHYHKKLLNRDISDDGLKSLTDKFSDLVLRKVAQAPFIRGAFEFIDTLYKHNKKMFIISGTPEKEMQRIIREKQLDKYFSEVKGSPISKSDNLKYLLEKYKISASGAIFFGDSPEDLNAATSLGVRFIPINYSIGDIKGYKDFVDFTNSDTLKF